jgi:hypothetical protein
VLAKALAKSFDIDFWSFLGAKVAYSVNLHWPLRVRGNAKRKEHSA